VCKIDLQICYFIFLKNKFQYNNSYFCLSVCHRTLIKIRIYLYEINIKSTITNNYHVCNGFKMKNCRLLSNFTSCNWKCRVVSATILRASDPDILSWGQESDRSSLSYVHDRGPGSHAFAVIEYDNIT
jgi:hypothetical protein